MFFMTTYYLIFIESIFFHINVWEYILSHPSFIFIIYSIYFGISYWLPGADTGGARGALPPHDYVEFMDII